MSRFSYFTMRLLFVLVTLVTTVFGTATDPFPKDFPECGKTCVNNMLGKSAELSCPVTDVNCLCKNQNFVWGIRDCSVQSCPQPHEPEVVLNYGLQLCKQAGVEVPSPPPATVIPATASTGYTSSPAQGSPTPITNVVTTIVGADGSSVVSTITGSGVAGAGDLPVPVTSTEANGSVVVHTSSSAIAGASPATTGSGAPEPSPAETTGAAADQPTGLPSQPGSGSSTAESSSSSGLAVATAVPAIQLLAAAAGVAVAIL